MQTESGRDGGAAGRDGVRGGTAEITSVRPTCSAAHTGPRHSVTVITLAVVIACCPDISETDIHRLKSKVTHWRTGAGEGAAGRFSGVRN